MKKKILIKKYKKILNHLILLYKNKLGRPLKYNNNFYLNYILRILFYGDKWNTFICSKLCDRSTIRKRFYKWQSMGIFSAAYDILKKKYLSNKQFTNLFIDASVFQNEHCSNKELINYYYKFRSKKQTKLSCICDNNSIILSYQLSNPKYHDRTFIKPLLKKLPNNIKIIHF